MYNERERIINHRQLLSPESAAADLRLLRQVAPRHPRLAEFSVAPRRHHDAILMELLAVASRGDIVKNRLASAGNSAKPEATEKPGATEQPRVEKEPEQEAEPKAEKKPEPAKKKAASASRKKTNTPTSTG